MNSLAFYDDGRIIEFDAEEVEHLYRMAVPEPSLVNGIFGCVQMTINRTFVKRDVIHGVQCFWEEERQ